MKLKWRFGIIAGIFLAIFSLYPQFKLIYQRGADWNGHYAYNDIDEVAYASYLQALIDGRPRKNDPYTGRDDSPETPQPESLFSIQFAGPMTVAVPARLFGIDAPWAMTISGALAAFLTALAIFWLLGMMTGNSLFAMAGSLTVLAGGALFAGEGALGEIIGNGFAYPYFPGFRRYVPAMSFPAFFLLIGLVWNLIRPAEMREVPSFRIGLIVAAVLAFSYTVFSYFYVWTTAAAWLGCLGLLFLIFRPAGVGKDIRRLLILAAGCVVPLIIYAWMLSNRSQTMDDVQLLVRTRVPDLIRVPELIGFLDLLVIGMAVGMKLLQLKDRNTLFAISLALTPAIVFNQQIVTGQALQPIHYQVFIGNYVAGLALLLTAGLLWRSTAADGRRGQHLGFAALAVIAIGWGFVEAHYTVRVLDDVNIARDEAYPVGQRLTQLAVGDEDKHKRVVLHLAIAEGDDLPTIAPQSVLWARHQHVFPGVEWQESKERYYQQLLYQGVSDKQLADGMKRGEDFVSMIALFGWGRHTDRLNSDHKPLTLGEIDDEARRYSEYAAAFDARSPDVPRLDYLVTPESLDPYLGNVEKWYELTEREQIGKYILYRLRLK